MAHYYCSTYSKDYIYKGLVLYDTLKKYDRNFHFFFICLHDEVKNVLERLNLNNATLISMKDVEDEDRELAGIKAARNDKEYVWTSKASALLYLFDHFPEMDHIIWLDGDTAFFSDTQPIFDEWGDYSILLTEEKYTGEYDWLSKIYGVYNTGFMGFKRGENSFNCLHWFRERLIEWCFEKPEGGKWSDQMYVNDWPARFDNVGVVRSIGINANLFIIQNKTVARAEDDIYIGADRLILFHFYGFKYYNGIDYDLCAHGNDIADHVLQWIYLPYVKACNEAIDLIYRFNKGFNRRRSTKGGFIMNYFRLENNPDREKGKYNICAIINSERLIKGLALYCSLRKHARNFRLWICCMDDVTYDMLADMGLESIIVIDAQNIEDGELLNIKDTRKPYEYCRALKAPLVLHILRCNYYVDYLAYADADVFSAADPPKMPGDGENGSIFVYQRGSGDKTESTNDMNRVGLIGFRRDENAFKFLWWWRGKCLEWHCDGVEQDGWEEGKYIDDWPHMFSGVKIITI
ncbi:MAG: glycosyltransferase [Bacillota bacterium]